MGERTEILFRIIVSIVSGIILGVWKMFITLICAVNWVITIFTGKRNKEIAELSEYWNTETYKFIRYLTLVSNKRPFPFSEAEKMSKFER